MAKRHACVLTWDLITIESKNVLRVIRELGVLAWFPFLLFNSRDAYLIFNSYRKPMTRLRFSCEKLIRDTIPERLEKKNIRAHCHSMEQQAYQKALLAKLIEEAHEVQEAQNKQELVEELADVFEIIRAIMREHNITQEEVEQHAAAKCKTNGAFDKKIYCSYIEMDEDNPHAQYYLDKPKQYPQL